MRRLRLSRRRRFSLRQKAEEQAAQSLRRLRPSRFQEETG